MAGLGWCTPRCAALGPPLGWGVAPWHFVRSRLHERVTGWQFVQSQPTGLLLYYFGVARGVNGGNARPWFIHLSFPCFMMPGCLWCASPPPLMRRPTVPQIGGDRYLMNKLRHPNIVLFIGVCFPTDVSAAVYLCITHMDKMTLKLPLTLLF